jgi:hypothetical protein
VNAALTGGAHKEEIVAGKPFSPHRHYRLTNRAIATEARQRHARHLADRRAATIRRPGSSPASASIEDES